MSEKTHAELIKRLSREIREYDHYYFNENTSLISDEEYDRLFEQLRLAEEQFPHLKEPDSPTNRISAPLTSSLRRLKIPIPMMSLGKVFTKEDIIRFIERVRKVHGPQTTITYEPKYDGLGLRLVYRGGILKEATTRGDGDYGEDILANVLRINGVPHRIKMDRSSTIEIRGEVVADVFKFIDLNDQLLKIGQRPYSNVRNFVSGNLRQSDPNNVHGDVMTFVAYDVVEGMELDRSYSDRMAALIDHGFTTARFSFIEADKNGADPDRIQKILDLYGRIRESHWCEMDGIVFKVDNLDVRSLEGTTSKHPRWAIAYKFPPMAAETAITDMKVTVGRTGVLTPVATLEPVKVGGVTVTNVSFHNFDKVKTLNLNIGDRVRIVRAGDVIPHVDRVIKKGPQIGHFPVPRECPCCGSSIVKKEGFVELFCENDHCPVKLLGRLIYFASRDCADIQLLGETYVEGLFDKGFIKTPSDIYRLTEDQIAQVAPPKVAKKIITNIEKSKGMTLERFIKVLGIPNVGEGTARRLAAHYGNFESFLNAEPKDLWNISDVGEITANSVYRFLKDPSSRADLLSMYGLGVTTGKTTIVDGGPLSGQVWCITGSFRFMKRPEIKQLLMNNGAKVVNSVTKQTTHLLMGEEPGSKYDQAIKNNCIIVDDAGFNGIDSIWKISPNGMRSI